MWSPCRRSWGGGAHPKFDWMMRLMMPYTQRVWKALSLTHEVLGTAGRAFQSRPSAPDFKATERLSYIIKPVGCWCRVSIQVNGRELRVQK